MTTSKPLETLDKKELLVAIDKASDNLRTILQDDSIRVVLIDKTTHPNIIEDYKIQWNGKGKFHWDTRIAKLSNLPDYFHLAIYADDKLLGLSETQSRKTFSGKTVLERQFIEGRPSDHKLKGYIIASFSQANLDIAKHLGYSHIASNQPRLKIIPTYWRIGFRPNLLEDFQLFKSAKTSSILNWQNIFERQHQKGRYVPAYTKG